MGSRAIAALVLLSSLVPGCWGDRVIESVLTEPSTDGEDRPMTEAGNPETEVFDGGKVLKSEEEWRRILSPEQFAVLRKQGTERAFSCGYWDNKDEGIYRCAGCGLPLFSSKHKFRSGTGWPSFFKPVHAKNITTAEDRSLGTVRTEVLCARCGGHMGHVFEDGPEPTGSRYCINSVSLDFVPAGEQ